MSGNNDVACAAVCGGAACAILICLFVIGIPTLIAGFVLISEFDETHEYGDGPHIAGIVCIVVASLMITAGVITAIFTCVYVGRAASAHRTQNHGEFAHTQGPTVTSYPGAPQYQGQGQAYYPTKSQGQYPPQVQFQNHPTPQQYAGNQNPSYLKY